LLLYLFFIIMYRAAKT